MTRLSKYEERHPKNDKTSIDNADFFIKLASRAKLPTRFGIFTIAGFYDSREKKEHTAVIKGDVAGKKRCPVRIHSECHTGDVFCSLKCDCRQQLEASLKYISMKPFGILIYLKQEGRGIGLLNKIKAYQLQDSGLDTVEANEVLGYPDDMRDYSVAAGIISMLKIKSISLLTNSPDKIKGIEEKGIKVIERIPVIIKPNHYNKFYLETKSKKMGHLL